MTSRERLLAAMRREQPDRVPIHIRGVPAWNDAWADSRHASFAPLARAVRDHCDVVVNWSPDSGWFLSAAPGLRPETRIRQAGDWELHELIVQTPRGPLTSVTRVHTGEYSSMTAKFWIGGTDDLACYRSVPYAPPRPAVESFFALERDLGSRGIVLVNLPTPIACVHDLLGSELLAVWSIQERGLIRGLLDEFTARILDLVSDLLDRGVCGVFGILGEEYVGPGLHSPRDFHEFCTEPESQIARLIHSLGGLVHLHCHGPLDAILEEFPAIGADCLHPIEQPPMGDMPLAEAKRRIGERVCLEGNIQIGDLYGGTPDQIREAAKRAIEDGVCGGGFILCPSASPYTKTLPPRVLDNYLTMIETGLEFGRY